MTRRPGVRSAFGAAVGLLGAALLALAAFSTSAGIERFLLGEASGKLDWGPALFRAVLAVHGAALVAAALVVLRRGGPEEPAPPSRTPAPPADPAEDVPFAFGWLAILCAVALALRLWRLESCLWLDEMFTMVEFLRRPVREIVTMFPSQNQHMLYSVLGRACVVLLGETAFAARIPAVLFGVGSIWALGLLGRRMVGWRTALLACTLMTFSYHHVWFSQNARGYTGLLFFATLGTFLWLEATTRGTAARWIGYAACMAFGLWTHMTMVFVLGAHAVAWASMLLCSRGRGAPDRALDPGFVWKAWLAWMLCGTVTLQLHALALPEFLRSALHETSPDSEWRNPLWVVTESLLRLGDAGAGVVVVVVALAVAAAGFVSLWRRDRQSAILAVAPAILGGGAMIAMKHNLWPRFFFFCMGTLLLVGVHGGMVTVRRAVQLVRRGDGSARLAARLGTAAVVLAALASAFTLPRCYALPKQDYTGARDFVEASKGPGDAAVAVGLAGAAFRLYFAPEWAGAESRADLDALRRRGGRVWLVYTLPIELRATRPDVWNAVREDFREVRVFEGTLGGGEVVVCVSE